MKRILRIALSVATLVLIAGAAVYIALGIGRMRIEGEQTASAEYTILRNAASMISGEQDLGDQFVRDRLKSLYQASSHLLAMQILDKNGLVLWKLPDESAYFSTPSSGSGSVFNAPGISTVIYMTPLAEGMKLMALYSIFSRKDFSSIIMLPLIGLALWLVFLVIMLIVLKEKGSAEVRGEMAAQSGDQQEERALPEEQTELIEESSTEPSSEASESAAESAPEREPAMASEPASETVLEAAPGTEPVSTYASQAELASEAAPQPVHEPVTEFVPGSAAEPGPEPIPEPIAEPVPKPVHEFAPESITESSAVSAPEPIHENAFEPIPQPARLQPAWEELARTSGAQAMPQQEMPQQARPQAEDVEFGQAEFIEPPAAEEQQPPNEFPPALTSQSLERMLESELQSRHSSELSLMLIECALAGHDDPSAAALGVTIKEYVTAESLVFEMARGCYAVVLPGVDAGSCLKLAVDLDDMLTATASLYKDITGEPPFYFGISAVYGRTLTASRLYREAYAALEKARESSSRILAFKPAMN